MALRRWLGSQTEDVRVLAERLEVAKERVDAVARSAAWLRAQGFGVWQN